MKYFIVIILVAFIACGQKKTNTSLVLDSINTQRIDTAKWYIYRYYFLYCGTWISAEDTMIRITNCDVILDYISNHNDTTYVSFKLKYKGKEIYPKNCIIPCVAFKAKEVQPLFYYDGSGRIYIRNKKISNHATLDSVNRLNWNDDTIFIRKSEKYTNEWIRGEAKNRKLIK